MTAMETPTPPKFVRLFYPFLAGLLFGLLQTGLFFQLSFSLSSGFTTYIMVTLCWVMGSAGGLFLARERQTSFIRFLGIGLLAYFACILLLMLAPFETRLWPVYALLVAVMGLAPGIFFARMASHYPARELFFRENNGFIVGLICGTLAFLLAGRVVLWLIPPMVAMTLLWGSRYFLRRAPAALPRPTGRAGGGSPLLR
jgi:hypothetical protein